MAASPDIEITQKDRRQAARDNREALARKISGQKPSDLAEYLLSNFETFERILPRGADLDETIDTLRGGDKAEQKKTKKLLGKAVSRLKDNAVEGLAFKKLGIKEASASDYSFKREREAAKIKKQRGKLLSAAANVGKFATGIAAAHIIVPAKAVQALGAAVKPFGYLLKSMGQLAAAYPKPAALTLSAALAGAAGYGLSPVDSAPYLTKMNPEYAKAFSRACTPDVLKGNSPLNAQYAIYFEPDGKNPRAEHAYHTMMSGARHGVPAIGLHFISYFETIGFREMMAQKSSASNPFQFLNETKLVYLKRYGAQTFEYQEAADRIAARTGKPSDHLLVNAIDTVRSTDETKLREMARSQKMPGSIYEGIRTADLSAMASELIALDIAKQKPGIKNPSNTPEQVLDMIVDYYDEHHFLGMGNYALLSNVAKKYPNLPLSDKTQLAKHVGEKDAGKITEFAKANPVFFKDSTTAPQALAAIKQKFVDFVKPEYQRFAASYTGTQSVSHICLAESGIKNIPETIPRYQVLALQVTGAYQAYIPDTVKTGLQKGFIQATNYFSPETQTVEIKTQDRNKMSIETLILQESQPGTLVNVPLPTPRPEYKIKQAKPLPVI
ncbi:MAG: hypothetical protein DI626_06670 [Micavibrio aeruginosavorus]|uniref:Uncharacterized protein n=1 Tax=Micavibrio aeruginosavorus TaxID=349221 RepID=A0A2W5A1U4_9BACT|nr:MAG: hypothetical protein DI626_06670 [Micavibrio aeruginosavorus]